MRERSVIPDLLPARPSISSIKVAHLSRPSSSESLLNGFIHEKIEAETRGLVLLMLLLSLLS